MSVMVWAGDVPDGYMAGLGRDVPHPPLAHLYKGNYADPGLPMCPWGWNRDRGQSFSIWRGNVGAKGVCKRCLARARKGLAGVPAKRRRLHPSTRKARRRAARAVLRYRRAAGLE